MSDHPRDWNDFARERDVHKPYVIEWKDSRALPPHPLAGMIVSSEGWVNGLWLFTVYHDPRNGWSAYSRLAGYEKTPGFSGIDDAAEWCTSVLSDFTETWNWP